MIPRRATWPDRVSAETPQPRTRPRAGRPGVARLVRLRGGQRGRAPDWAALALGVGTAVTALARRGS